MGYSLHARVCIYLADRKNPLEIGGFFLSVRKCMAEVRDYRSLSGELQFH